MGLSIMWNEFLNHFGGMKRAKTIGLLVVAMATKKTKNAWQPKNKQRAGHTLLNIDSGKFDTFRT